MDKTYDLIILGAGPAGLTAGIYGGRSRLSTLLIEKGMDGGQIVQTDAIENYPGQIDQESGITLMSRMSVQAAKFGVERATDIIQEVHLTGPVKQVIGERDTYESKTIILATGAKPRSIGCIGEEAFRGRGISYCATCDAAFFRDLEVYVVGGGDTAVQEAVFLTKFARKVTIIHRRDSLRAAKSIQEKAFANPKIGFMWDSVVAEVGGEDALQWMSVKNVKTGAVTKVTASEADGVFGLFGFTGMIPGTDLYKGQINMENGYIVTDEDMKTSEDGVFAAGDLRRKSLRQVVTAAADGAIAAAMAEKYIEEC